ncbi:MAG: 50S ribosomal protein L11 methyltransferase [Pseudomonadota bacterium]
MEADEAALSGILQARTTGEKEAMLALEQRLTDHPDGEDLTISCYAVEEDGPWAMEILFPGASEDAVAAKLDAIFGADAAPLLNGLGRLADENWVAKSLAGLKPVSAGRFFVHGSHDRHRRPAGGHSIEIDANLAFGTGHHGSTQGCLIALDRILKRVSPRRILDLGTGSGVLAFASVMALKRPVLASDIDPIAVETARTNAAINNVSPWVEFVVASGLHHPAFARKAPYDLVLANIIARPLAALAPALGPLLDRRATLILSGLRPEDGRRVLAAYRPWGLVLGARLIQSGWMTLILERRP